MFKYSQHQESFLRASEYWPRALLRFFIDNQASDAPWEMISSDPSLSRSATAKWNRGKSRRCRCRSVDVRFDQRAVLPRQNHQVILGRGARIENDLRAGHLDQDRTSGSIQDVVVRRNGSPDGRPLTFRHNRSRNLV